MLGAVYGDILGVPGNGEQRSLRRELSLERGVTPLPGCPPSTFRYGYQEIRPLLLSLGLLQ
jgi:hypothetical protein